MLGSIASRLLLALSFAATAFASDRVVNVPLTDPGSDIQLDFVVVPGEDFGNFTAWPDEAVIGTGYPLCSANYQLRQDLHTLNLTNAGNSKGGGGIFVVGISYFPDPLESNLEIWGAERRRGSHMSQRTLIFAATFSSVVGLSLIACLVGYLRHMYLKKRKAKKAAAGGVEMDDLRSDATTSDQKQAAPKFVPFLY
ncbi:hypothetical protein FRC00_010195 [Tulasnella sp. 408]|nr:hypothetical protein FRC00_010195 [Tulasnella sp. 408]